MKSSEAEVEISNLREKLSDALAGGMQHKSDCSVCAAPAYEPTKCDCGTGALADRYKALLEALLVQFSHQGCSCTFSSDDCCGYSRAQAFLANESAKRIADAALALTVKS